jgi:hypothetical protein
MKKTYIIPELEVVRIQTQQMLAASVLGIGENYSESETVLAPEMDLDDYFDGGDNLEKFFE